MKFYIINGPNLNMLGIREPDKYGIVDYKALCGMIKSHCDPLGIETVFYQSNHEGDLVDKIQEAYFSGADGIVINPGAYTLTHRHTKSTISPPTRTEVSVPPA